MPKRHSVFLWEVFPIVKINYRQIVVAQKCARAVLFSHCFFPSLGVASLHRGEPSHFAFVCLLLFSQFSSLRLSLYLVPTTCLPTTGENHLILPLSDRKIDHSCYFSQINSDVHTSYLSIFVHQPPPGATKNNKKELKQVLFHISATRGHSRSHSRRGSMDVLDEDLPVKIFKIPIP